MFYWYKEKPDIKRSLSLEIPGKVLNQYGMPSSDRSTTVLFETWIVNKITIKVIFCHTCNQIMLKKTSLVPTDIYGLFTNFT